MAKLDVKELKKKISQIKLGKDIDLRDNEYKMLVLVLLKQLVDK